jgi:hypothetical protein
MRLRPLARVGFAATCSLIQRLYTGVDIIFTMVALPGTVHSR